MCNPGAQTELAATSSSLLLSAILVSEFDPVLQAHSFAFSLPYYHARTTCQGLLRERLLSFVGQALPAFRFVFCWLM
jgi:hypothetical protein